MLYNSRVFKDRKSILKEVSRIKFSNNQMESLISSLDENGMDLSNDLGIYNSLNLMKYPIKNVIRKIDTSFLRYYLNNFKNFSIENHNYLQVEFEKDLLRVISWQDSNQKKIILCEILKQEINSYSFIGLLIKQEFKTFFNIIINKKINNVYEKINKYNIIENLDINEKRKLINYLI